MKKNKIFEEHFFKVFLFTNVGAVDIAGLFPNKLEFNVDTDVVAVTIQKIILK